MTTNYYLSRTVSSPERNLWSLITSSKDGVNEQLGELTALASKLENLPVTALIDAAEIRVVKAKIPGRSEAQVRQAAPYVIEEDLAGDVDDLTIMVSQADSEGFRLLTIYNPEIIELICGELKSAGVNVAAVIPDAALIEGGERDSLAVILENNCARISYQSELFTAVEYDVLPGLLVRLIRDQKITEALITITPKANLPEGFQQQISDTLNLAHPQLEIRFENVKVSALCYAVSQQQRHVTLSYSPDLLPESMRGDGSFGLARNKAYSIAAGLAVCALVAHIGFSWSSTQAKAAELVSLKAQQQEIFGAAFPEVKRVVNAEAQAQQRVKELREKGPPPAEFLSVLYTSARLLQSGGQHTDQGNNQSNKKLHESGVQLTGFSYADGVLLLRTESVDMAMLEKYRGELSGFLSAEVVNVESSDDIVRGAIRVRAKQ